MFENIPYKKKFYALIAIALVLSLAAYKRSFKGTIESVRYYYQAKKNIDQNQNIEEELLFLKAENKVLDQSIGKEINNPEIVQNRILSFINNSDIDLTIARIEPTHRASDPYFNTYSNQITLKGSYEHISKMIFAFEEDFEYARIATTQFYVKRDPRTRKKELYNDIIFQNYEKKK